MCNTIIGIGVYICIFTSHLNCEMVHVVAVTVQLHVLVYHACLYLTWL